MTFRSHSNKNFVFSVSQTPNWTSSQSLLSFRFYSMCRNEWNIFTFCAITFIVEASLRQKRLKICTFEKYYICIYISFTNTMNITIHLLCVKYHTRCKKKKNTMINKHILKNSWANSPGENSKDNIMLITYEFSNQGEKCIIFWCVCILLKKDMVLSFSFLWWLLDSIASKSPSKVQL